MAFYDGNASWFCCGPNLYPGWCDFPAGSGACQTCDNSARACAWPKLGNTGCNYTWQCVGQIQGWCGQLINVRAHCYGTTAFDIALVDCGPDRNALCGLTAGDCLAWPHPLIDLTPAAFSELAPLEVGRISVTVETHF
jgi:hypothetical protein